ncbi:MAG: rod shape-determining protein RodA [Candidatus Neomarinimicrobiota bacterium]|nr:rod shape-determining protein RodA [Candidatus Neomarinimicrobiota bacterium]
MNFLTKSMKSSPYSLLLIILGLLLIGLTSLYSIAAVKSGGESSAFLRQLFFLIPSIVLMIIFTIVPRKIIHEYIYIVYTLSVIAVFIPFFGSKVADTHRWINIGLPFNLQPSEIAKLIVVLTLARYLSDRNIELNHFTANLVPFVIAFIPAIIVLNQPDLGTALVMMSPVIPMLYWVGARPFHLFLVIAPIFSIISASNFVIFTLWSFIMGLIIYFSKEKMWNSIAIFFLNIFLGLIFPLFWNNFLRPYHRNRILTALNPELDPLGSGYQVIQSKTALGSGGFFGKGWGEGTQTQLKFLPVQESDFIVSVIGEEMGFILILTMLTLFLYLILKIINLAHNANDRFSSLVLIGISTIFLSHIFVNCSMASGMIPVKGLPLPFISYGGSFLLSSFIMIGIVINFSKDESYG